MATYAEKLTHDSDPKGIIIMRSVRLVFIVSCLTFMLIGCGDNNPQYEIAAGSGIHATDIIILKPTGSWEESNAIAWSEVIFFDEPVRFIVKLDKELDSLDKWKVPIEVRSDNESDSESSTWSEIDLESCQCAQISGDNTALHVTLDVDYTHTLSMRPSSGSDSVTEFSSADTEETINQEGSNANDSEKFVSLVSGTERGRAREDGDIDELPPISAINADFIKAAGIRYVQIKIGDENPVKSSIGQLMDQADSFYVSAHGSHASGAINGVSPSDVSGLWNRDLDEVFLAGCSVLDINDYNGYFSDSNSPGEAWATKGPSRFFGYNATAPLDHQAGDPNFSADIVQGYFNKISSDGKVLAWGKSNKDRAQGAPTTPTGRPWNACVIDKANGKYWYWNHSVSPFVWTSVSEANW